MFYSSRHGYDEPAGLPLKPIKLRSSVMKQKTDGRVVRLLTKHLGAEDRAVEQWFLVAIGDDDKARDAVARSANAPEAVVELVGHIPATTLAGWGMDRRRGSACSSRRANRRLRTYKAVQISETDDAQWWMFLWGSSD